MKFATILPFVVGALAAVSRRQTDNSARDGTIISQGIQNLTTATNTLDTQVNAFSGDITAVQTATDNVFSVISAAQAAISPIASGSVTGAPLLQLSTDTQNLNTAVSQAINDTIAKKSAFVAAGFGPTILASLQQQLSQGNALQSLIISKLDPSIQSFAASQSTTAASIQRGIDAFADQAATTTTAAQITTAAQTTTTAAEQTTTTLAETTTTSSAVTDSPVTQTTLSVTDSTTVVITIPVTTTTSKSSSAIVDPGNTNAPVYPTGGVSNGTYIPVYPTKTYTTPFYATTVCPTESATIPYYPHVTAGPTYGCACANQPAFSAPVTYVTYCPKPTTIVWYGSTVVVAQPKTVTLQYTKTVVVSQPTVAVYVNSQVVTLSPSSPVTVANACPSKAAPAPVYPAPVAPAPNAPAAPAAPAPAKPAGGAVQQIGDGQIQSGAAAPAPKPAAPANGNAVQQIGDGQIQSPAKPAGNPVQQIGDGQVQVKPSASAAPKPAGTTPQAYTGAASSVQVGTFGAFAVAALVAAF